MGSIYTRKGKLGATYRVVIRQPKNKPITKTFKNRIDAENFKLETEYNLHKGNYREDNLLFADLIDRYFAEVAPIKPFGRSKIYLLQQLRDTLGHLRLKELTANCLLDYARHRFQTCCASTVKSDMLYIGVVLSVAESMWGAKPKISEYRQAMANCARLQIVAPSNERDRRVSDAELQLVLSRVQSCLPVRAWAEFSLVTTMRLGEIAKLRWSDISPNGQSCIVRQRKHPLKKRDELVPLVAAARAIIDAQVPCVEKPDLIFPQNKKSITAAFRKAIDRAKVEDLRFHDLRHEAITRLLDVGLRESVVARFSGHRNLNQLKKYSHMDVDILVKSAEDSLNALR